MKALVPSLIGALALTACAATPPATTAQTAPAAAPAAPVQTTIAAKDVQWGPAPPVFAPGAQMAVLHGDPSKAETFVLRLKFPKGFHVAPHRHPGAEIVTVISGTYRIGVGDVADPKKAKPLPAGGFWAYSPGTAMWGYADTETVLQLNAVGPLGFTYVNPAHHPQHNK